MAFQGSAVCCCRRGIKRIFAFVVNVGIVQDSTCIVTEIKVCDECVVSYLAAKHGRNVFEMLHLRQMVMLH